MATRRFNRIFYNCKSTNHNCLYLNCNWSLWFVDRYNNSICVTSDAIDTNSYEWQL